MSNLLAAIIAFGVMIFVHELGHFLVAKACGVKCEKFYVGFDIGGWRIARRTWGCSCATGFWRLTK